MKIFALYYAARMSPVIEPTISIPVHTVVIKQIKRLRSSSGTGLFLRAQMRRRRGRRDRLFIHDYRRSAARMIDFTRRKLNNIFLNSFNP